MVQKEQSRARSPSKHQIKAEERNTPTDKVVQEVAQAVTIVYRIPRELVSSPSLTVLKQRLNSHLTEMLIV